MTMEKRKNSKMWEVWLIQNGELSTSLYIGTLRGCKQYIKQAIKKGAKEENLTIIKA